MEFGRLPPGQPDFKMKFGRINIVFKKNDHSRISISHTRDPTARSRARSVAQSVLAPIRRPNIGTFDLNYWNFLPNPPTGGGALAVEVAVPHARVATRARARDVHLAHARALVHTHAARFSDVAGVHHAERGPRHARGVNLRGVRQPRERHARLDRVGFDGRARDVHGRDARRGAVLHEDVPGELCKASR